jgi:hypothetical protein
MRPTSAIRHGGIVAHDAVQDNLEMGRQLGVIIAADATGHDTDS